MRRALSVSCLLLLADFTVLDANPLDNIANSRRISRVFLRGREVDRAALRAKWQARWPRK
jgi:hypothetical protein